MPKRGEAEVRKEEGRLRSRPRRVGGGWARRGEAKRGRVEVEAWLKRCLVVALARPRRRLGEAVT